MHTFTPSCIVKTKLAFHLTIPAFAPRDSIILKLTAGTLPGLVPDDKQQRPWLNKDGL